MAVVGDYELQGPIGEGGFAVVHVGRRRGVPGFSPIVAIKRLKPAVASDHDAARALIDEARTSSHVQHPNVVRILDVVSENGEVLLVLELVVGVSLARLIRNTRAAGERIPPRVACAIVAGTLRGLAAAHEARHGGELLEIVHRDVSPDNVIVDEHGTTKLTDFGIARARGRLLATAPDVVKGKLRYMAPEYLKGDPSGATADVHAAGVVLWEALTGSAAFSGNEEEIVRRILAADLAPPSTLADVPLALDRIVARSVTPSPAERYQSARAMLDDLEATSLIASAEEVAAWVAKTAADDIEQLRTAISTVEREATTVDFAQVAREEPALQPAASRTRNFGRLVAAVGVLGALGVVALGSRTSPPPATAPSRSSAMPPREPIAPAEPSAASASPSSPAPSSSSARPAQVHRGVRPPARPKPCEPPWTIDDKGIKRYKDECL